MYRSPPGYREGTVVFVSNKKMVEKELLAAEERILEASGAFVTGQTQLFSPVDTGQLRDSYIWEVDVKDKAVYIGSKTVPYSVFQEFGTYRHKAQPHLTPAAFSNFAYLQAIAERELSK